LSHTSDPNSCSSDPLGLRSTDSNPNAFTRSIANSYYESTNADPTSTDTHSRNADTPTSNTYADPYNPYPDSLSKVHRLAHVSLQPESHRVQSQ
jgi:hypothetical protein